MSSMQNRMIEKMARWGRWKQRLEKRATQKPLVVQPSAQPKGRTLSLLKGQITCQHRVVYILGQPKVTKEKILIYFHGGAYISGFDSLHWKFLAGLADKSPFLIYAPDYRTAPEGGNWQEALALGEELYREIRKQSPSADIIMMGDSAGGGLALALTQLLVSQGQYVTGMVLISPWLDARMTNPALKLLEERDPFLSCRALRFAGEAFCGEGSVEHPGISPLLGAVDGLPPILLFTGDRDILLADAQNFRDKLEAAEQKLYYFEEPEMFHVWPLLPIPEAGKGMEKILDFFEKTAPRKTTLG